jgi:putative PIN family toxin of toxin-antitoxin system
MHRRRVVFDINVLVSRLLLPASTPDRAVRRGVDEALVLVSEASMIELADVLSRPKFDPYVTLADRRMFLQLLGRIADMVPVVYRVQACRDPKDDMVLELALNGRADLIVTGDADLLALRVFRDIPIVTPRAFLGP